MAVRILRSSLLRRALFCVLGTIGSVVVMSMAVPERVSGIREEIGAWYQHFMYERVVRVSGHRKISQSAIERRLPTHRSNVWWWMNSSAIEKTFLEEVLVKGAQVSPCHADVPPTTCFEIRIEERAVALLAVLRSEIVLLDNEGVTLGVIPLESVQTRLLSLLDPAQPPPVTVSGLLTDGVSHDVVRARVRYLVQLLEIVSSQAELTPSRIELLPNGETEFKFVELPYTVRFENASNAMERFRSELERLAAVRRELQERERFVERVDLAFEKVAVVSFKKEYEKEHGKERQPPTSRGTATVKTR